MLELDHVFCMVADPESAVRRLEEGGWVLDAGRVHEGQGTRNRRLRLGSQFLELLWVWDAAEARANPVRLDRRADWASTGASPFGLGFRGHLEEESREDFWPYDALGPRIWIHRDNEQAPERPLVFAVEVARGEGASGPEIHEVRVHGPSAPRLPRFTGPAIAHLHGSHLLELTVGEGGSARRVSDILVLRS